MSPREQDSKTTRSRPCDACRRRKSKCVTEEGKAICVLCQFHGQRCTYLERPQPRKRSSVSHDTLSVKRNRVFHTKPGTGCEEEEYDTLRGPSLLKRTLGLQNRHHTEYVGPNAIPDVYGTQKIDSEDGAGHEASQTTSDQVRFVHPSAAFRIVPDNETAGYEKERSDIDEIEATAQGHGPELVQLYFRIVHPSFPILHKDVFLEKYARSYREFSPPLLGAVYLLASGYWGYSESLAQSRELDLAKLQTLAFKALQNTMHRPKLSTIQAGLLLSQHQKAFMGTVPHEQRDRLTVQLVNIAHGLGLHLDCSSWEIPDWEVGLRRRIGWALYMQDKWSALLESRPSLIIHEEWDVACLSEDDFPDNIEDDQEGSSEVFRGLLVFMHMAELTVIVSEILSGVFSARARRTIDHASDRLATLLEQMKPLQIRLKSWFSTLPDLLKMDTVASMKLSPVGYLRLAYLTIEVCLHRNLLRTLVISEHPPDPTLSQVCRAAANERFTNATDFIQRLQAQHLASFWYFTSAKCCALIHAFGKTLESTAKTPEEAAFYERKLKEFKWTLKVNSEAGASFMRQALAFINQPVRVVPYIGNSGPRSTTSTSPMSTNHQLPASTSTGMTPDQYASLNHHQQNASASMPYTGFGAAYHSMDHPDFPSNAVTDEMFAHFYDQTNGVRWPQGLS